MSDELRAPGHAFLSYVREDSGAVDRLERILRAAGVSVWRDTDLRPGEDWRIRIRHAITRDALAFIACFSTNSTSRESSYQREELTLAIEQLRQRKPDTSWLLPVRLDDCIIPDLDIGGGRTLASIQRADLFGDRRDEGVARLVAAVLGILGSPSRTAVVQGSAYRSTTQFDDNHMVNLFVKALQSILLADIGERGVRSSGSHIASDSELSQSSFGSRDVDEDELSLGSVLGRGGQGTVIPVKGSGSGLVYKRFRYTDQDFTALRRLQELRAGMAIWSRRYLDLHTAWPLNVVLRNGEPSGYLMQEVPATFLGQTQAGYKLRELQYLLYKPTLMWGDIRSPDIESRTEIALEMAMLIRFLHEQHVVVGDLSMSNLLWSADGPAKIFMIDCDTARLLGHPSAIRRVETAGWADPLPGAAGPDLESDRYKLALAVGRVLSRDATVVPGQVLPLLPGVPKSRAREIQSLWSRAALPRAYRPDAMTWVDALAGQTATDEGLRPRQGSWPVVPFYLVCDASSHMAGEPIDALNASLTGLHQEIGSNPALAERVRFCLIEYSDDAEVLLPLADLSALTAIPKLRASGGRASYDSAFNRLYETISRDVTKLKNVGSIVYRPAVYFLAGIPSCDEWTESYNRISDRSWDPHPNIFTFGFGMAREADMSAIATVEAFMADGTVGPADVLRSHAESLIRSVINSVTVTDPGVRLSIPESVPGFTSLMPERVSGLTIIQSDII